MRNRSLLNAMFLTALLGLAPFGCSGGGGGGGGGDNCPYAMMPDPSPPPSGDKLPCDVYKDDNGPCVAAHSTIRALLASYNGPLYQVKKSDGTTLDIMPTKAGGPADAAPQDPFCGDSSCTISKIYDQSGQGNDLTKSPPGMAKPTENREANAKALPVTFGGKQYYGLKIVPMVGYRNNSAKGTAIGDDAETEYMVAGATFYNGGCCFDYGNMETNSRDNGEGTMEAIYFGSCTIWNKGAGDGPWVMGDLENGLWAGNKSPYTCNPSLTGINYVTGLVKGDASGKNHWALKYGNAESGRLNTPFDGPRPSSRYNPMRKEGAIGLGTGGDNSSSGQGYFFEGVMTAHFSSDTADELVQANVVSFYGAK